MTSTRLPGKVLRPICGIASLQLQMERVLRAETLDGVIIATTVKPTDDPVVTLASQLQIPCFRGSEDDVLSRFVGAVADTTATHIVRLTGDCPLADPAIIDRVVQSLFHSGADYASNTLERTYPIGMDVEIFNREALGRANARATRVDEREHVTLHIYRHPEDYRLLNVLAPAEQTRPDLRLTLDTVEDLRLIESIYDALYPTKPDFDLDDILALLDARPELAKINSAVPHNWVNT